MLSLLVVLCCLCAQSSGAATAALEGDIVNAATNAPIENARVRLIAGRNDPLYVKADRQGHFAFPDLAPGVYNLTADSPGYRSGSTAVDLSASERVQPRGGTATLTKSVADDGTIRVVATVPLTAYAAISGKVTDPDGLPMMNCQIQILKRGRPQSVGQGSIRTDDRGEYRVGQLDPGTYWVAALRDGGLAWQTWEPAARTTYFPAAITRDAAKPVELAAGQVARADIRIVRQAGVRVAGRLISPPGAPAVGVPTNGTSPHFLYTNLRLQASQHPFGTNIDDPVASAQQDEFEFNGVLSGKYVLVALTIDASTDPLGHNQKPVYGFLQDIEVGNRDVVGFDVALQPLRDLAGEVTFGEGCKPVPLTIRPSGYAMAMPGEEPVVSGADGAFVLTRLTSGRFTVNVSWDSGPSPGPGAQVSSIRLGERDVQKDGLDVPYSGDGPLRIAISCTASGRPQ